MRWLLPLRQLQTNPSNFLATPPTFLAAELDLMRLAERGRVRWILQGRLFNFTLICTTSNFSNLTHSLSWHRLKMIFNHFAPWTIRQIGCFKDISYQESLFCFSGRRNPWPPPRCIRTPQPNVESQSPAAKKHKKLFHSCTMVSQPLRAKREQKRLDSQLSTSVSDHRVTSSDPASYLSCSNLVPFKRYLQPLFCLILFSSQLNPSSAQIWVIGKISDTYLTVVINS